MKKLVLLTGALISLGTLSACGSKQAKDIDMSVSEMDEKFKLPDNLLAADEQFAQYAVVAARENLEYGVNIPRQTTYQRVSNLNAYIAHGNAMNPDINGSLESSTSGQSLSLDTQTPIDSKTAYRNDYTETVSWYDNDLYEYTLSGKKKYVSEDGNTLNYKNVGSLYNYWPVADEDQPGHYKLKNYVKETKAYKSGMFDYTTDNGISYESKEECHEVFEDQIGAQVAKMYLAVIDGKPGHTDAFNTDKKKELMNAAIKMAEDIADEQGLGYDTQLKFYRTQDYKTIYIYQSNITNVSFVFPTNNGPQFSFNDKNSIIPIYSVQNLVGKVTRYGNSFHDWRVDYVGMFGKTYAVKDNNLVTFDKPRCVSSEYYYISSIYNSIGTKAYPKPEEEGVSEYDNKAFAEEFKGFAVQNYTYDEYSGRGDHDEGRFYRNLDTPNSDSRFVSYSDMAGGVIDEPKETEKDKPISLGDANLTLTDHTVDYRNKHKGEQDIDKKFYLHGSYSTSATIGMALISEDDPTGLIAVGNGILFGIIDSNHHDNYDDILVKDDIIKSTEENTLILNPNENLYCADIYKSFGGKYYDEGDGNTYYVPYTINNVKLGTYDIDILIQYDDNEFKVESVELYYNNGEVGPAPAAEAEVASK